MEAALLRLFLWPPPPAVVVVVVDTLGAGSEIFLLAGRLADRLGLRSTPPVNRKNRVSLRGQQGKRRTL